MAEHDPFVVSFWVFDRRRGVVRRGGLWTRITPLWQIDYGQPATLPAALGALVVLMGLLLLWIVDSAPWSHSPRRPRPCAGSRRPP